MKRTQVGLVGCGNISSIYLTRAKIFPMLEIAACADLNDEAANEAEQEHGCKAMSVDDLLADPDIEIVLNLTNPQAHTEINTRALEAGKHVYTEKPLAISREDGKNLLTLARQKGLLIGGAPDTFLGGGYQTVRRLIDDGEIGRPVAGTAFMMSHGPEDWHPNPAFLYLHGGGPVFDMGPYYIAALVHLLGPVRRVAASAQKTFEERIATSEERNGERLPVEVPTHVAGTLEFENDSTITMIMSFDVWLPSGHFIEIHGETGSIQAPDPDTFEGPVRMYKPGDEGWLDIALTHGYVEDTRSIGLADMARAIEAGRSNRCSGELAYHVLDVVHALHDSAAEGTRIDVQSTCERPAPLPEGLKEGELD